MNDHLKYYPSSLGRDIVIEEDEVVDLPDSPSEQLPPSTSSTAVLSSQNNFHHQQTIPHPRETMPSHHLPTHSPQSELGKTEFYVEEDMDEESPEDDASDLTSSKHLSSTSTLLSQTTTSTPSRTNTGSDSTASRLRIHIPVRPEESSNHDRLSFHPHSTYDEGEDIEELEKLLTPKKGEDHSRGVHFDHSSINKEAEELFVKTLSARKASQTHEVRKPLPTTPKGEKTLEEIISLSPIGKAKFLQPNVSPQTKHFVGTSKMFHVTAEQTHPILDNSNPTLSYKNMSGMKLSRLEQIYQNYSKPIQLTPYSVDEAQITEKRLKKIRSSVPFRSDGIVKADVLYKDDFTHSPTSQGTVINSSFTFFKEANTSPSSLNNTMSSVNMFQESTVTSPKNNPPLSPTSTVKTLDSPTSQVNQTIRASSPTNNGSPPKNSWSKFTGGFYNSPRCFNTNHKHLNDPNFLRKNANEEVPAKRIMVESEKDSPHIQKKKEEIKTVHKKNGVISGRSCSPTSRSRNESFDGSFMNSSFEQAPMYESGFPNNLADHGRQDPDTLSIRAHSVISPTPVDKPRREKLSVDEIHKRRIEVYNNPNVMHAPSSFVTQFRPKHHKKQDTHADSASPTREHMGSKKDIKVEHLSSKKANFFNFKDFDRSTMALVNTNDPALEKMFDPKNYPPEMQAQVEYFKRRRNMTKNDYQNFSPNRSQKNHTPYLYYRRNNIKQYMEFKHKVQNVLGEELSELPHNIFKDKSQLNISLPSIKQKLEDHKASNTTIY